MRKILFPAVAVALIASSMGSFAATDTMTTGVIKSIDLKAMTLTLEDGTVYVLPKAFKDPGLKAGEKVTVGWQMQNTKHQADTVVMAK
jgi:Cu/Ag efflux protein CusF